MIFAAFKTYRDVKNGVANPTGFGQDAILEVVKIPLIIFTVGGVLALALFFILGWTELLSGPFGFFRFLFWFLLIPFTVLQIFFWKLFSGFKKLVQRAKNRVDEEVNTIRVEVK
jgi:hypothetical protein